MNTVEDKILDFVCNIFLVGLVGLFALLCVLCGKLRCW